jgi:hypothetical protein
MHINCTSPQRRINAHNTMIRIRNLYLLSTANRWGITVPAFPTWDIMDFLVSCVIHYRSIFPWIQLMILVSCYTVINSLNEIHSRFEFWIYQSFQVSVLTSTLFISLPGQIIYSRLSTKFTLIGCIRLGNRKIAKHTFSSSFTLHISSNGKTIHHLISIIERFDSNQNRSNLLHLNDLGTPQISSLAFTVLFILFSIEILRCGPRRLHFLHVQRIQLLSLQQSVSPSLFPPSTKFQDHLSPHFLPLSK